MTKHNRFLTVEDPKTWRLSTFVVMVSGAFYPSINRLVDFLIVGVADYFSNQANVIICPFAGLASFCITIVPDYFFDQASFRIIEKRTFLPIEQGFVSLD